MYEPMEDLLVFGADWGSHALLLENGRRGFVYFVGLREFA